MPNVTKQEGKGQGFEKMDAAGQEKN